MGNDRAEKAYLKILDITPHVNSITERQNNYSGVIRPSGHHAYFHNGKEISVEEFNAKFPIVTPRQNINQYGPHASKNQIAKH